MDRNFEIRRCDHQGAPISSAHSIASYQRVRVDVPSAGRYSATLGLGRQTFTWLRLRGAWLSHARLVPSAECVCPSIRLISARLLRVSAGRSVGAAGKFTGSGGAVVALCRDEAQEARCSCSPPESSSSRLRAQMTFMHYCERVSALSFNPEPLLCSAGAACRRHWRWRAKRTASCARKCESARARPQRRSGQQGSDQRSARSSHSQHHHAPCRLFRPSFRWPGGEVSCV